MLIDLVQHFKHRKDLFIEPGKDPCHYNWAGSREVALALRDIVLREIGAQKVPIKGENTGKQRKVDENR